MLSQKVTCVVGDDHHQGAYRLFGHGDTQTICVAFDGAELSVTLGGLVPWNVARTLLAELVLDRHAADALTRRIAERHPLMLDPQL